MLPTPLFLLLVIWAIVSAPTVVPLRGLPRWIFHPRHTKGSFHEGPNTHIMQLIFYVRRLKEYWFKTRNNFRSFQRQTNPICRRLRASKLHPSHIEGFMQSPISRGFGWRCAQCRYIMIDAWVFRLHFDTSLIDGIMRNRIRRVGLCVFSPMWRWEKCASFMSGYCLGFFVRDGGGVGKFPAFSFIFRCG